MSSTTRGRTTRPTHASRARTSSRKTGSTRTGSSTAGSGSRRVSSGGTRRSGTAVRPEIQVVPAGPGAEAVVRASVGVLCLLGLVMVFSASSVSALAGGASSWTIVSRQALYMMLGVAAAVVAARIPLQVWRDRLAVPLMYVALALQLCLALDVGLRRLGLPGVPFAIDVKGATRWVGYGPLQGQPSDLLKLAMVLWLARLLDVRQRQIGSMELLRPVLVMTGFAAALVLAGDDLGTTLLLGVIVVVMLFLAGTPVAQVAALSAAGLLAAVAAITMGESFRLRRIVAFLSPEDHASDESWQMLQSQIGLATGGMWGNGPGNSRAKWGYLPEAHNDFILAVIGEELGLVGPLLVLGAFGVFILAGIRIAVSSPPGFGRNVAFGITTWIGVQALINIAVTVGALPTKGITLPFVSYGGSSLVMCLVAVGVLTSVARER